MDGFFMVALTKAASVNRDRIIGAVGGRKGLQSALKRMLSGLKQYLSSC